MRSSSYGRRPGEFGAPGSSLFGVYHMAGLILLESVAVELLPVKDSLEATLAADSASLESLKNGVELTLKQLSTVFGKAGLKEIDPAGEKFDPHRHQAISVVPAAQEPNTVVTLLQKGYAIADRVLRPALVTVTASS